jgi:hypothetical protein
MGILANLQEKKEYIAGMKRYMSVHLMEILFYEYSRK